ncbi:MAG TPA: hypothetical protein VJH33_00565 [Candidatus Paceibacterota bacterium]
MEQHQNSQEENHNQYIPSTPQLALAALFLSIITGGIYVIDTSPSQARVSVAATSRAIDPFLGMTLEAKSALAVDLKTDEVLYALYPDIQLPLASLAKIALVLSASEVLSPNESILMTNSAYTIGSADTLEVGEEWLVRDIVDYTLMGSSNGGALALERAADQRLHALYPASVLGSATLYRMNSLAKELGMLNTFFLNTSGLDEDTALSGAYGSAHDIVLLLEYALKHEDNFTGTTKEKLVMWKLGTPKSAVAFNTNEALPTIPGLVFGKTGFTDLAGGNLAVVFEPEPSHPVAVVILGSTQSGRFADMTELVRRVRGVF